MAKHLYINPTTKTSCTFVELVKSASAKALIDNEWYLIFGPVNKNSLTEWSGTNKACKFPKNKMKLKSIQKLPDATGIFEKDEIPF